MGFAVEAPLIQNLLFFQRWSVRKPLKWRGSFLSCIAAYGKVYERIQEQ